MKYFCNNNDNYHQKTKSIKTNGGNARKISAKMIMQKEIARTLYTRKTARIQPKKIPKITIRTDSSRVIQIPLKISGRY